MHPILNKVSFVEVPPDYIEPLRPHRIRAQLMIVGEATVSNRFTLDRAAIEQARVAALREIEKQLQPANADTLRTMLLKLETTACRHALNVYGADEISAEIKALKTALHL